MEPVPECPTCGGNSAVTATATADAITYRCAATYAHDDREVRFWSVPKRKPRSTAASRAAAGEAPKATKATKAAGKTATKTAPAVSTAELTAPLLAVLSDLPHVWIEHGVVEYRLRQAEPELFGRHVAEKGHATMNGGTSGTTASGTRFATALLRLERDGSVTHYNAAPTGEAWEQDKLVGYWAVRPKPSKDEVLTWEQYATETLERTDGAWTDEDRAEVARLAAEHGR